MPPKITVIIPTKDEQDTIGPILEDTKKALDGINHEIIVVDASNDDTPARAMAAGAKLVRQIGSGGVGEALVQGFYWAKGEHIAFFDGDGTYSPFDIHKLVQPLLDGEADLVNGNRFFKMEEGAMTLTNRIGNRFLTWVGNVMFHMNIRDSQSGMKAFRRDVLKRIALLERGFPICSEILAEASKLGLRITEVGITYRRRVGSSKLKPASAGPKILLASLNMLRDYDPLLMFGGVGLALMVAGATIAWPVILEYLAQGTFTMIGRALIAIFCWLTGLISIFTGLILDTVNYSFRRLTRES